MKKSFSLLELIFAIVIIAIIASVAIPKLTNNLSKANIVKLKSDINAIRSGLNEYKNDLILQGEDDTLDTLDDGELLFKNVINYELISQKKPGFWEKIDQTTYKAWIDDDNFVLFSYNKTNSTFDCDIKQNEYCKELTQ